MSARVQQPDCTAGNKKRKHSSVLIESSTPSLLNTNVTVLSEIIAHTHITLMQHMRIYELTQIHIERSINPSLMTNSIMRSQLKEDQPSPLTLQSGCFRCLSLSVWDVVDGCTIYSGYTEKLTATLFMHVVYCC